MSGFCDYPWLYFYRLITASLVSLPDSAFLIREGGPVGRSMDSKAASKDRFFIVIRGKSRKGFCRGCIGRVEGETARGDLMGLLYGCGSNAGSPKSGGLVKAEDAYPLTRHQAQLLLYVSSPSRRLELLCNPQLFSAVCELSPGDLVVMRHKKGHVPGVVKNLMQIGKKESKEDLSMLGFEVELVVSSAAFFLSFNCSVSVKRAQIKPLMHCDK